MFEKLKAREFQVETLHHAEAILKHDMPEAAEKIEAALLDMKSPAEELIRGGGGEGKGTQRLRAALTDAKFLKHSFEIKKIIDNVEKECVSHEIDHVRRFHSGVFALEVEWNNKDRFFDRDLENFKRLHADGAISIGAIVTPGKLKNCQHRSWQQQNPIFIFGFQMPFTRGFGSHGSVGLYIQRQSRLV